MSTRNGAPEIFQSVLLNQDLAFFVNFIIWNGMGVMTLDEVCQNIFRRNCLGIFGIHIH